MSDVLQRLRDIKQEMVVEADALRAKLAEIEAELKGSGDALAVVRQVRVAKTNGHANGKANGHANGHAAGRIGSKGAAAAVTAFVGRRLTPFTSTDAAGATGVSNIAACECLYRMVKRGDLVREKNDRGQWVYMAPPIRRKR